MYIHIGNRIIVSDKSIIGIFNIESLKKSELNKRYLDDVGDDEKTLIIGVNKEILKSIVSPYTIIKRNRWDGTFVWRREDDHGV